MKRYSKKISLFLLLVLHMLCYLYPVQAKSSNNTEKPVPDSNAKKVNPGSWTAIDGLGRTVPGYSEVGETRKGKYVGLFYWTWHYYFISNPPRNLTEIMQKYPEAKNDFNHQAWENTSEGTPYFWNKPLYGYYSSTDEYVLRKHAELLADAGVDVIFFDCTNGSFTWKPSYTKLLEVFSKAREEGVKTPQIGFMLNFAPIEDTITSLKSIYKDIYKQGKYQDLWFYWEGKPLIMAHPECLDTNDPTENEIFNFFTFRRNEPTYFKTDTKYDEKMWGWCAVYPQAKYGIRDDGSVEEMAIIVAQNANEKKGLTAMNDADGGVFGRSYTKGDYSYKYTYKGETVTVDKNTKDSVLYGLNFEQQWEYALKVDPDFIFVTGWNEWIAGRHKDWLGNKNAFPDEFTDEYSRDIEPSEGFLKDHYYYQLVSNIRRFKGVDKPEKIDAYKTIDIKSQNSDWDNIYPAFTHYENSTYERDTKGWKGTRYTNEGTRNDIVLAKVAYDDEFIYFMVETKDNLTSFTDNAWMRLFIDTKPESKTFAGWEGFEYVINKTLPTDKEATVEKFTNGWESDKVGTVEYTVADNRLQIKVPRAYLGFEKGSNVPEFNFKWVDNMKKDGDILDFYINGDAAPGGRFVYQFKSFQTNVKKGFNLSLLLTITILPLVVIISSLFGVKYYKKKKRSK